MKAAMIALALFAATPVLGQEQRQTAADWQGPYAVATTSIQNVASIIFSPPIQGLGGRELVLGYNHALSDNVVVGAELLAIRGTDILDPVAGVLLEQSAVALRGRVGVPVGQGSLVYGALGVTQITLTATPPGIPLRSGGVMMAAGVDTKLNARFFWRAEVSRATYERFAAPAVAGLNWKSNKFTVGFGMRF